MITGTSQADAAVIMIASGKGDFEAGSFSNSQTRDHALLAQTLGVKELVVAIIKMDGWFQPTTFKPANKEIKADLTTYLNKVPAKI